MTDNADDFHFAEVRIAAPPERAVGIQRAREGLAMPARRPFVY